MNPPTSLLHQDAIEGESAQLQEVNPQCPNNGYRNSGQQQGPVSPEQLKQSAASGQLQPGDLVLEGRNGPWIEARKIKGLFLVKAKPVPASGPTLPG